MQIFRDGIKEKDLFFSQSSMTFICIDVMDNHQITKLSVGDCPICAFELYVMYFKGTRNLQLNVAFEPQFGEIFLDPFFPFLVTHTFEMIEEGKEFVVVGT